MLNAGADIGQPETDKPRKGGRTAPIPTGLLASRALAKGSLKGKMAAAWVCCYS